MAAFTYPGVYIEEISSGVHTITGVATSIAALVGWANMGPTGRAVLVQSWSDFQNQFGGLSSSAGVPNYLGYATGGDTAAVKASVPIPYGGGTAFTVTAIDEGQWANNV